MRSFKVPRIGPREFVDAMRTKLAAKEFDRYVALEFSGDSLVVELRWMGTTRFDYQISETNDGFQAELVGQKVAPLHAAFSDRFEGYFEDALSKVGATAI